MCLQAVPLLASVAAVLLFLILLFSIAGTSLFPNVYHEACIHDATGELEQAPDQMDAHGCGGWRECPSNYTCTVGVDVKALHAPLCTPLPEIN